jgi:signal peptidase I
MSPSKIAPADSTAVKCELASEVLRSFGGLRFAATGWSMLPAIWPGDILVVERVGSDEVRVGEVVLVGRDGRLCAHRVVSRSESLPLMRHYLITQGDALAAPDRAVSEGELLGRVVYLIRAGERIAVPAKLSLVARLIARIIRHFFLAARALVYLQPVYLRWVYLHRVVKTSEKSGPEGLVSPCQG